MSCSVPSLGQAQTTHLLYRREGRRRLRCDAGCGLGSLRRVHDRLRGRIRVRSDACFPPSSRASRLPMFHLSHALPSSLDAPPRRIILDALWGHRLGTHASIPFAFWVAGASGVAAQVLLSVSLVAYLPDDDKSAAGRNLKDRPPADFWMDFWMVVVRRDASGRPLFQNFLSHGASHTTAGGRNTARGLGRAALSLVPGIRGRALCAGAHHGVCALPPPRHRHREPFPGAPDPGGDGDRRLQRPPLLADLRRQPGPRRCAPPPRNGTKLRTHLARIREKTCSV